MSSEALSEAMDSDTVNQLKPPVWLRNEEYKLKNWLRLGIQNLVFYKFTGSKNVRRSSILLLRAVFSVTTILLLATNIVLWIGTCFKMSSNPVGFDLLSMNTIANVIGIWLAAVTAAFWNMRSIFHQQWEYAANLHNQIIGDGNNNEMLRCKLASELVILDLWAHRSFRQFFASQLGEALKCHYSKSKKSRGRSNLSTEIPSISEAIDFINGKKLRESQALELLNDLQHELYTSPK